MMRRVIVPLLSLGLLAGCVATGPGYYAGPVHSRPWGGGWGYAPPPPRPVWGPPAYAWRAPPPRHWGGHHHGRPGWGHGRGHGRGHWR